MKRTTLSRFLLGQLQDQPDSELLAALIVDIAAGVRSIATLAARPRRSGHDDAVVSLESAAHAAILRHCDTSGLVSGIASCCQEDPSIVDELHRRGPYLLHLSALEGTNDLDIDACMGTVFGVSTHLSPLRPTTADFLRPGSALVAAGYALYGPATVLVVSVGRGTHGFTLDREHNAFVLSHPDMQVVNETTSYAVDTSHERFWESPVARYVGECKAGRAGARGHDFTMRWSGSAVAEVHRVLVRGGVYLDPADVRDVTPTARLHLCCEAAPLAMLVEQAGGLASTGRHRLLDARPDSLTARVPALLGSRDEILRLERYHDEHDRGADQPFRSPLFSERSLYRPEPGVCGRAATCPQSTL